MLLGDFLELEVLFSPSWLEGLEALCALNTIDNGPARPLNMVRRGRI